MRKTGQTELAEAFLDMNDSKQYRIVLKKSENIMKTILEAIEKQSERIESALAEMNKKQGELISKISTLEEKVEKIEAKLNK